MADWLTDVADRLSFVGRRVMLDQATLDSIGHYQFSMPTSPSPGRIYKRLYADGPVVFICEEDPDDTSMVVHKRYAAIVMRDAG